MEFTDGRNKRDLSDMLTGGLGAGRFGVATPAGATAVTGRENKTHRAGL
jgi:hypothetical protein